MISNVSCMNINRITLNQMIWQKKKKKNPCPSEYYFTVFSQTRLAHIFFFFLLFLNLIHGLHNKQHFQNQIYFLHFHTQYKLFMLYSWINKINLVFLRTKNSTSKSMSFSGRQMVKYKNVSLFIKTTYLLSCMVSIRC